MNGSLEFLNMIKNQSDKAEKITQNNNMKKDSGSAGTIAVIDTETNWRDQVMSLGVAIADGATYKLLEKRYYIFDPECLIGGIYSGVMYYGGNNGITMRRQEAMENLKDFLYSKGVERIFAYNAKFDCNHLPELCDFEWYDIMRVAAYKQFNPFIPESIPCCKTGRLKTDYGVEPIMKLLTGDKRYREIHNAVYDAVDELKILELLGHPLEIYECGKLG